MGKARSRETRVESEFRAGATVLEVAAVACNNTGGSVAIVTPERACWWPSPASFRLLHARGPHRAGPPGCPVSDEAAAGVVLWPPNAYGHRIQS
jgi:hypothetical protein